MPTSIVVHAIWVCSFRAGTCPLDESSIEQNGRKELWSAQTKSSIISAMKKYLLALDLGKGSLGLALSRSGEFITPLKEIRFPATHYEVAIAHLRELLMIEKVETFVLGLPLFPSGDDCEMTPIVRKFADTLHASFPNIEIVFQDERNSTVEAASMLRESGKNAKKAKANIDSAAAFVILKRYLVSIDQYEN